MNQKVVKSKASTVVASLPSVARSSESGQGDGATLAGGEKENLISFMLLAGLTTTATKSKKSARTLADTKLELEVISQCGSGELDHYKPSRTNMARIAMQEYLKELRENSNLNRKKYGTVMSSEANEIGLQKLLEISWRAALQTYFDETMHAPATVAAYLAYPCTRTDLQVRLAWCLMGIKKAEYEANNDSKSKEQELELMELLQMLISRDNSAIAWTKRKDALCFVRFVVDRIPAPVLVECIKPFGKGELNANETSLGHSWSYIRTRRWPYRIGSRTIWRAIACWKK